MVVNHIQDHRHMMFMTSIDEPLEALRPSIGILDGERVNSIISPVPFSRKSGYRHDIQSIYS
jgi:hypothetical protein